jgi:hypothetical protein
MEGKITDSVRPSTLNEINHQLQLLLFRFMNDISPRTWTDPKRLIYSPVDDLDFATTLFEGRDTKSRPEHLLVPFAYFTRASGQATGDTWNYARQPGRDWVSTPARIIPRASNMVKFVPATFQYFLKIFDNRVQKMETLIDIIIHRGIREYTKQYFYDSEVMQGPMPYTVEIGSPQYDRTPSLRDRTEGKGRLYSIVVPFEVSCALGVGAPVKRIEKIEYDVYHKTIGKLSRPSVPYKLEGILIDANTDVGDN